MLITEPYREMNRRLLAEGWGNSASVFADRVLALHDEIGGEILDYGCGRGALKYALGRPVREYDPCVEGKDAPAAPADLVCCIDVLEHVEPELLDGVLAHIASLAQKAAFLVIATRPAVAHLADGRNAHLTVEPIAWWRARLLKHFARVEDEVDLIGAYVCTASR